MFPDSVETTNSLTIEKPIKIKLSLGHETMAFIGLITLAGLVYGVKRLRK